MKKLNIFLVAYIFFTLNTYLNLEASEKRKAPEETKPEETKLEEKVEEEIIEEEPVEEKKEIADEYIEVEVLEDLPTFTGMDAKNYTLKNNKKEIIPIYNAKILSDAGKVKIITEVKA